MPNPIIKQILIGSTTYDIQDEGARELISALGDAVYWAGVTTTELVDGVTTSPTITVNGESVTCRLGAMAQYEGEEFVYNDSTWQSIGKNNFGDLAFKNSASGSYTPAGTVTVTADKAADTISSVTPFGTAGTLPTMSVTNGVLTLDPGTLPTAGTDVDVVTNVGAITATAAFLGTAATITVQ